MVLYARVESSVEGALVVCVSGLHFTETDTFTCLHIWLPVF